jgi:nucleolar pre-ribosomal-associated protein 1
MQEKPHVVHILNLLKSTIPPTPSDAAPIRLPAYTTLILCHALQGVFYPSNFIYPLTARFLLQRPELDIHDVPMLFGMLFSNSDEDWRKERSWIIRFLADGMLCTADWKVLKRRHSWDLLASIFQSFENDRALRLGILEVKVMVPTDISPVDRFAGACKHHLQPLCYHFSAFEIWAFGMD